MQNNKEHPDQSIPHSPPSEIDYTPRKYKLNESIQIMLKFFSIPVIIFLLIWIFESR